jgi:cytochrome c oxidase subunit 3
MASHAGVHHDPDLAHHFESPVQQYQSARLGMWIFLVTEILFFGGLFCAYSVYRANHPEIFLFGHLFLDKHLGAINTVVLICSSFTIAWAVRAAQLRQIGILMLMLALTILCAFGFLGIKYMEYSHKWHAGLLWARSYNPHLEHGVEGHGAGQGAGDNHPAPLAAEAPAVAAPVQAAPEGAATAVPEHSNIAPAAEGPAGLAAPDQQASEHTIVPEPRNAQTFFSIYFLMTGLHGIHVLGGIGAMFWLLALARRGDFDTGHFTKVDIVALYWHLVDLIWIYLFLLLYLIH